MTRDIQDRLRMFGAEVKVERIALNMDQIRKYKPPPNPAKLSDSRCKKYIEDYGSKSWELDSLPPDVLNDLITDELFIFLDRGIWDRNQELEREGKNKLLKISKLLGNEKGKQRRTK